jgi:hypothetical protein
MERISEGENDGEIEKGQENRKETEGEEELEREREKREEKEKELKKERLKEKEKGTKHERSKERRNREKVLQRLLLNIGRKWKRIQVSDDGPNSFIEGLDESSLFNDGATCQPSYVFGESHESCRSH